MQRNVLLSLTKLTTKQNELSQRIQFVKHTKTLTNFVRLTPFTTGLLSNLWVQNALYENSDDAASVIRVIDLYKVDTGKTPSDYKRKAKDAAKTVSKGARTSVDVDNSQGTFKESNVAKMSFKQYEDNASAIDEAIRSGRFIYDLSGGAR